jgi:2-dehydropantoate 2-reductase
VASGELRVPGGGVAGHSRAARPDARRLGHAPTIEPVTPHVAVVGPGAIGATVAACLVRAGKPPLLCGRTPLPQIVVEPDDGEPVTVAGPVHTDPVTVPGPAEHVLVAVKATQVAAAAPWLRRLAADGTVVTVLQNGVDQLELVGPHAPGAAVIPSVVWFPAETLAPGRVRLRDTPRLTVPEGDAGRSLAQLLAGSGCEVEVSADFTTLAWRKLVMNALAGLMVLSGRRAEMFRRGRVAGLARAYALECLAVARAEGADLPDAVADEIVAGYSAMPRDLGSSILFDREAGRPLEWEARNAVVARRARGHGIPTPISDVVVPLLEAASGD